VNFDEFFSEHVVYTIVYVCMRAYMCVCESNLILLQSFKSFFQRVTRFDIKFRVFLRNKMHLNTSRHRNAIHEECFEHVFCVVIGVTLSGQNLQFFAQNRHALLIFDSRAHLPIN